MIERKRLVLADLHIPFQNKNLLKKIYQLITDMKEQICEIIFLGDLVDFFLISHFMIDTKETGEDLSYEINESISFLCYIRQIYSGRITIVRGNHEIRLEKYLLQHAKAFRNLPCLKFESLLNLKKLDINCVDYIYLLDNNFMLKHGESVSLYPARSEIGKEGMSGMSGHCHRTDRAYKRTYNDHFEWYSLGHLADKDLIDKNCKYSQSLKWDSSFAIISHINKIKDIEIVHCKDNKFYVKQMDKYYEK